MVNFPRTLELESYEQQRARWPRQGRQLLAHFDTQNVVVYQAFRPEIAAYAVEHRSFGGPFYKLERMSWIKTSFLWMMYRCGWASKEGQESVLAIHLRRDAFLEILSQTVPAKFTPELYADNQSWQHAVRHSNVRLQWDPDRVPSGNPLTRRAIQLGLQGSVLRRFVTEWTSDIEDITVFVHEQRKNHSNGADLLLPRETLLPIEDPGIANRLGLTLTCDG